MLVLCSVAYSVALYHGFILAFILGFMSLMLQAAPCEPASASVVESREPAAASRLIGTILGHLAFGTAAQGGRSPPGHYSALFFALYMLYTPLAAARS